MKARFCLIDRSPGTLWIGPGIVVLTKRRLLTISAAWGWDKTHPLSLRPTARRDPYPPVGDEWLAGWLGFTLSLMVLDRSTCEQTTREGFEQVRLFRIAPHSPHAAPNPAPMPTPAPVAESGTSGLYGQEEGTK